MTERHCWNTSPVNCGSNGWQRFRRRYTMDVMEKDAQLPTTAAGHKMVQPEGNTEAVAV